MKRRFEFKNRLYGQLNNSLITQAKVLPPLLCLAALVLALASSAGAEPSPAAMPISDIGAKATADYLGDVLSITATPDGARLRCGFQKLEGHATTEGLWLESTKASAAGKLRLVATAIGRAPARPSTLNPSLLSEAKSRLVGEPSIILPTTGTASLENSLVRFTRPGVTEEYSVSVDGVRQDFVVAARLAGAGDLRVELALSGARAEAATYGAKLMLAESGRALAYNRLRVKDATGHELTAHLEVLTADRLAVSVADADAVYPVRIDPTFSDADWVSLNPGIRGANGPVSCIGADDNGNVYIGGGFTQVGAVPANNIAKWDGNFWSALGSGIDGGVGALAVEGTNVYAGGYFTNAGGVAAKYIAKWDGRKWSALGSGMDGDVRALAVCGTNLYAGGSFTNAGGEVANNIAKWNGSAWSALGSGLRGSWPVVDALAVMGTNLYAGGSFTNAGSVPAFGIAKWNGSAWSALGSGLGGSFPSVSALTVSGTDLYAGGSFTIAGGVSAVGIARWDGSTWSPLGSGLGDPGDYTGTTVSALAVNGNSVYAGGYLKTTPGPGGFQGYCIAKWDGSAWSDLGHLDTWVSGLGAVGTNLFVGGGFTYIDSHQGLLAVNNIAKWDGSTWSPLVSGMNAPVFALAVSGNDLFAGGGFTYVTGGLLANHVAKWDGSVWSALGSGINGEVRALAVIGTNLYAGGDFTTAGGLAATNIARWDGRTWSALGSGMNSTVLALAFNGTELYAGGCFTTAGGVPANYIAKWDGSAWSALGSGMDGPVYALAAVGTNLYSGGNSSITKWDGNTWSALASVLDGGVNALVVCGNNLYAGGYFTRVGGVQANNIARWDGNEWSALGSGMNNCYVYALAVDGTNLYAGEGYDWRVPGLPPVRIAEWDGSTWSDMSVSDGYYPNVKALALDRRGHLFVGGNFYLAGTIVSPFIAQVNLPSTPTILRLPESRTAESGSMVDFRLEIDGYPAVTCLLFFNGTNLMSCGANGCLELTNVDFSLSGTYTIVVTNVCGAVTSAPVMLNVIPVVERRPVPGINLMADAGSMLNLVYADSLSPAANWSTLDSVTLTSSSELYFDLTKPLPPQRFYRVWQTGAPSVAPSLTLPGMVPAITLTGNIGDKLRVDCINQFGPTDAWVTLDTVTLTNTSQLYFDVSAPGQPPRLWRIVPVP